MERTFSDIIELMASAEDYGDLYSAASFIKNQDLRVDVEQMIAEYEETDTDVEVAYSCVTSDLLDEYMYEDNTEELNEYVPFFPKKKEESKKVTEGKELNTKSIQEWVLESIKSLTSSDDGCCEYKLDDDLSLFCGWSDGYDPDDKDMIHSKNNPSYCINVGIKCNHDYMKTDYDFLNAPYDEETGEVWDTSMAVDETGITETDAQWFIDEYTEMVKEMADGNYIVESKKEEKKVSAEDEEYFNNEIDKVARQEIEDKFKNDKKEPDEEIEKRLDKVTESNELENSEEEDLATLLYTEAMEWASFDRDGKCNDYELNSLDDLRDWYDGNLTEETYNKVVEIVKSAIETTTYYNDSEGSGTYIELNDNHTMWDIKVPDDAGTNADFFGETYSMLVQEAAKQFKEETGEELKLLGRMGRHACVNNTFLNAYKYNDLKQVQEKLEKQVIQQSEEYFKASVTESIKIIEGNEEVSNAAFAKELYQELISNGYEADLGEDDDVIDVSATLNGATLGIMVYGISDIYDYDKVTVGLGGDTLDETVFPLYEEGWDYESGSPRGGKPEVGTEVYAMFKPVEETSAEEVVSIINKAFEAVNKGTIVDGNEETTEE